MINVKTGTNLGINPPYPADENDTLRFVLEQTGVDYSRGTLVLNGSPLRPGDLDKTFNDLEVKNDAYLISVVKADNA